MESRSLKRVSMLIRSKKFPDQNFVGYSLLHEFNPKQLSFFTSHKFPVDDDLEITVELFGSKSQFKVHMNNIHEQISSGRVMNIVSGEENPFQVRKFYRCYGTITALKGALPGTIAGATEVSDLADGTAVAGAEGAISAGSTATSGPTLTAVPDLTAAPDAQAASIAGVGAPKESLVTEATPARPDSGDVAAKLAAISDVPATPVGEEKQAA